MSRKRIRAAVIGVGYLGRIHAEKYAMIEEAELVGVVDRDYGRAKEVASHARTKAFPSYEELFGLVDAVSIVTPTGSHCKIGLDFLSSGVDVLVEKPIAMDTEEADRLIHEAKKHGRILQVGHLERFNAAYVAASERVLKPLYMEAHRLSPFPNRSTDVDVVLDVMIHDIDIILSLVKSEVASIEATGANVVTGKADIANARLKFKNGCVANITASRASRGRTRKLEVVQKGASMTVDFLNQHLFVSRPEGGEGPFKTLVDEEIRLEKRDSLLEELRSFLECSAKKKKPPVTGADGRDALRVAQMIQQAMAR